MMIKLDLKGSKIGPESNEDGLRSLVVESDYSNLKRMHDELKSALGALSDPYSRKIYKFVK